MQTTDFWGGLADASGRVFAAHPELVDHRADFPWLTGALGDPAAPVWFVAENPSLIQVRTFDAEATVESQWAASRGDRIFRDVLVAHGFKTGGPLESGGWRCYITDVIKSADIVKEWSARPEAERNRVAEAWAPVLTYELEAGNPQVLVVLGKNAAKLLDHLETARLVPALPPRRVVYHYSYLGQRPESGGKRRPAGHPDRIAEWQVTFAQVAADHSGTVP